ncbi:TonB-dependent receptor domain-containing protein [Methylobacillus pratensis]
MGIKHKLSDARGEVSLSLFHIAKDNIITYNSLFFAGTLQGGELSSRGIELSTILFPAPHWRIDLNATALNARYDDLADLYNESRMAKSPRTSPSIPRMPGFTTSSRNGRPV